jgi:hypothetical protein
MDPMLLQVKALAKAKAKAEAACGDDSCCGCCCCESSPSVSTISEVVPSPSPIPIPVEPSSGCSTGQHKADGTCVWDTVTVPIDIPDTCPSGFFPDGYGSCLP